MAIKIQLRRDSSSNWQSENTVLSSGEPALDTTNQRLKIGDGTTSWSSLPYLQITDSPTFNNINAATITVTGNSNFDDIITGTWLADIIALNKGGTNASLTAASGAIVYSTSTGMAISAVGNAGQVLVSKGSNPPEWESAPAPEGLLDPFLLSGM